MGDLSLIIVTCNWNDGAAQALDASKKFERDGRLEIMDYLLLSKDEKGRVTAREMSNERSEKRAAAACGAPRDAMAGSSHRVAVATAVLPALAGTAPIQLMEELIRDRSLEPDGLENSSSVLAVIVEERYAEQLGEELQKLGRTTRRNLNREECEFEYDAYLQRTRDKLRSIENDIQAQLTEARTAIQPEKIKIAAEVAAKRTELEAQREKLVDHMTTMNSGVRAEIREMNLRLELAGLNATSGIAAGIDHLHRRLNRYCDELENLIEDQLDRLSDETSQLKAKASRASGETKIGIEEHLLAVEVRLRTERAKLQDSFQERLLQMKQWFENLRVLSALARAEARDKLHASIEASQDALAELKARVRMRNREDERAWKDIRHGFRKAWKDLENAFDRASRERV